MITGIWFYHTDSKIGGKIDMANRQYIGARYVPKYFENPDGSNNWLTGIPYEALTVVTYADIQFISKKPVPANITSPNENPEYWIVSGQSGGISQDILNQINQNTADIEILKTQVTPEEEYKLVYMDSYGGWKEHSTKTIPEIANEQLPNVQFIWSGGRGFGREDASVLDLIQSTINTVTNADKVTSIYLLFGANDIPTTQTITNINAGISACYTYLKSKFPQATIYIGYYSTHYIYSEKGKIAQVIQAYKDAVNLGYEYITNCEYIFMYNKLFEDDMIHPNNLGVQEGAKYLIEILKKNECNVVRTVRPTISIIPGSTFANAGYTLLPNPSPFEFTMVNEALYCNAQKISAIAGNVPIKNAGYPDAINIDSIPFFIVGNVTGGNYIYTRVSGKYYIISASIESLNLNGANVYVGISAENNSFNITNEPLPINPNFLAF